MTAESNAPWDHPVVSLGGAAAAGAGLVVLGRRRGGTAGQVMQAAGMAAISNSVAGIKAVQGSRDVPADARERAVRLVEEVAVQLSVSVPRVSVIKEKVANAGAVGLVRAHLFITTGLLDRLSDDQVRGVVAHELRHLANHDSLRALGRMAAGVAAGAELESRLEQHRGEHPALTRSVAVAASVITRAASIALARHRESTADIEAARMTPWGGGLADALRTLEGTRRRAPRSALRRVVIASRRLQDPHPPTPVRLRRIERVLSS